MTTPSITTGESAGYLGGDTIKTAFWRLALAAFRAQNVFRAVADVKWARGDGPIPGSAVSFTIITALATATSALSETADPTPAEIADTQKTVTLVEYGNSVQTTKKFRLTTFLNIDFAIPNEVAANMEESLDIIARDVLVAGTNVFYGGAVASRVTVAAGTIITANNVRRARSRLAGRNTPTPDGQKPGAGGAGAYVGFIHPDVSYDLQAESGQQAWSAPHVYEDTTNIYTGEIGMLSGVRFVENANSKNFVDAGVGSTVDVYATVFVGQQALGEAVGEAQHMVISGPFDNLQRHIHVGWYGLLGFGRIREGSLDRLETSSSIGTNT